MRWLLALCFCVTGCVSVEPLAEALGKPVGAAGKAADIAAESEKDVLRAIALHAVPSHAGLEELLCMPVGGPLSVSGDLTVFVDALETIKKVGEKPPGASYAAYIRKFEDNQSAIGRDPKKELADEIRIRSERLARCRGLAMADVRYAKLAPAADSGREGLLPALGGILLLDDLIKSALAAAEAAQRDAAVRKTISTLLPQMKDATQRLRERPPTTDEFGPRVSFLAGAPEAAVKMNGTRLGAVVTIHRWFTMQRARTALVSLAPCRSSECLAVPERLEAADRFVESVFAYRSLAAIDTDEVLVTLDKATLATEQSLQANGAQFLDGLLAIGSALGNISDKHDKHRKSR